MTKAYEIAIPFNPSAKLNEFINNQKQRIVKKYLKKLFNSYVAFKKDISIVLSKISSFKLKKTKIIKINKDDFRYGLLSLTSSKYPTKNIKKEKIVK
jgi:hypothetical protein